MDIHSKLYMITGFLGAGKTTFLKKFLHIFKGKKVQLIVNEFGKEGVDGIIFSEIGALLNEISGGSIFCSCRMDQFEKVLEQSKDFNPDVILVEASGLSDPTGVRRLFSQTDRYTHIDYKGAICLIDATRFPKIYTTARPCMKQLAVTDIAVINKIDLASPEQLAKTKELVKGQRPDVPILETTFGTVDENILSILEETDPLEPQDVINTADLTLRKLLIRVSPNITPYTLTKFIEMFIDATFRIKGFVETTEGLYHVDCVGNVVSISPYEGELDAEQGYLVVLSGAGMPIRKLVKEAVSWYSKFILGVE